MSSNAEMILGLVDATPTDIRRVQPGSFGAIEIGLWRYRLLVRGDFSRLD
jgi:hypothetical protein